MGTQHAVDLSLDRWQIIQQLLSLVYRYAEDTLLPIMNEDLPWTA